MKKKVIVALLMLLIIIPIILKGGIYFNIAIVLLSLGAFKEIIDLKYDKKELPLIIKIIGLINFLIIIFKNNSLKVLNIWPVCILLISLLLPIVIYGNLKKYNTNDAFYLIGNILFLGICFNLLKLIYNYSLKYFFLMIMITILTDTFAQIFGMLIGKHKLTKLSPNKTVEGSVMGVIMATFVCTMFYTNVISINENVFVVILAIVVLSIVSQIGDLLFSSIKRLYNKKDFSNLIPAHGGILDRIDSLLFITLVFVIAIKFI